MFLNPAKAVGNCQALGSKQTCARSGSYCFNENSEYATNCCSGGILGFGGRDDDYGVYKCK